jgi:hypothetical protein
VKRNLFALLSEQRRFVYLAVALLSAAGIWAATQLPSAIYPELDFSRITIVVQGTSLGARQVLFSITRPIEEAVSIVAKAVLKSGKALCAVTQNMASDDAKKMLDLGVTALMVASDQGLLRSGALAQLEQFRKLKKES